MIFTVEKLLAERLEWENDKKVDLEKAHAEGYKEAIRHVSYLVERGDFLGENSLIKLWEQLAVLKEGKE